MSWTSRNCWGCFISNRYLKGMFKIPKKGHLPSFTNPCYMAVSWNRGTTKFRFGFAMICPCKTNHFGVPPFNQKGTSIPSPETQRKYTTPSPYLAPRLHASWHVPHPRSSTCLRAEIWGKRSTPQKTLDFTGLTNKHGKSICKSLDFIGKNGDLTNNHGDSNIQTWDLRI